MREIIYSQAYRIKILQLRDYLDENYGKSVRINILKSITDKVNNLILFPKSGSSVEQVFGIESDYWFIYVLKNYIFYTIRDDKIEIVNIYNEKEDIIRRISE